MIEREGVCQTDGQIDWLTICLREAGEGREGECFDISVAGQGVRNLVHLGETGQTIVIKFSCVIVDTSLSLHTLQKLVSEHFSALCRKFMAGTLAGILRDDFGAQNSRTPPFRMTEKGG